IQHRAMSSGNHREMSSSKSRRAARSGRLPSTLLALFVPGTLFGVGLFLLREDPRFAWLAHPSAYPWELWLLGVCGAIATTAGLADWRYHRSGAAVIGGPEHRSELVALAGGGVPLFVLMSIASLLARPVLLLIPVLIVVLFTTVMICYDEFVFHRKRCGRYETLLHRLLVFGNAAAWLAWMHWCFVRERFHG
ncbi:MAG: hypothetical protein ACRELG_24355, partial [Gemmataceae bacterium]